MQKKYFLFFLIVICTIQVRAINSCLNFYKQPSFFSKTYDGVKSYLDEVKNTKGVSLFLVQVGSQELNKGNDGVEVKWKGLLRPKSDDGFFSGALQFPVRKLTRRLYRNEYDFRPFSAFTEEALQPFVRKITQAAVKKTFQLSSTLLFGLGLTTSVLVYEQGINISDRINQNQAQLQFSIHEKEYQFWLENDLRFLAVKQELQNQKWNHEKALMMVASLRSLLNRHIESLVGFKSFEDKYTDEETVLNQLSNAEFGKLIYSDILNLMKTRINFDKKKYKEDIGFTSVLNDNQIKELVINQDHIMLASEIVEQVFRPDKNFNDWRSFPMVKVIIDEIYADPFNQKLISMYRNKELSQQKLISLIQENQLWKSKFEKWKILKLIPLKIDLDNSSGIASSNQPLQLKDIQEEIINSIQ